MRENLLNPKQRIIFMMDLGWGVLDGAQVETVCMMIGKPYDPWITFFRPNTEISQIARDDEANEILPEHTSTVSGKF